MFASRICCLCTWAPAAPKGELVNSQTVVCSCLNSQHDANCLMGKTHLQKWIKIYINGKTRPQSSQRYETSPTPHSIKQVSKKPEITKSHQVVLTNLYLRVWRKPTAHLQSISCQHSISFYKSWNLVLQHPKAPVAGIVLMSVSPPRSVVPCQIHTAATHIQQVGKQCWRTVSVLILPSGKHCRVQVETVSIELRKKLGRYYTNQPKPPHHSWTAAWAVNGHAPTADLCPTAPAPRSITRGKKVLIIHSYSIRGWFNPKYNFSHVLNHVETSAFCHL